MSVSIKTRIDAVLANVCLHCTVCRQARRRQQGAAFWFVTKIERGVCPFCQAYERVYGRKAHEPADSATKSTSEKLPSLTGSQSGH